MDILNSPNRPPEPQDFLAEFGESSREQLSVRFPDLPDESYIHFRLEVPDSSEVYNVYVAETEAPTFDYIVDRAGMGRNFRAYWAVGVTPDGEAEILKKGQSVSDDNAAIEIALEVISEGN